MAKNESKGWSEFSTLDDLVAFFDTHDLGEYWDNLPKVDFDVDIKESKYLFSIDAELMNKLSTVAKSKKISSEALANVWLREKIQEHTEGRNH